jgi:hypothetical protein
MDESFSPVIFVYGTALTLGVGKACTLLIWRTLPQPRPGLRQEAVEAWQHRTRRRSPKNTAGQPPGNPAPQTPTPVSAQDGLPQP